MKEFATAAKTTAGKINKDAPIITKHDGRTVKFYEPDPGSFAIMMMIAQQVDVDADGVTPQQLGAMIEFIFNTMEEGTAKYFRRRLMDPNDTFSLDGAGGLMEIFKELTKEWSARPTQQPPASARSRQSTGRASTDKPARRASTSSRSRSAASSQ